MAKVPREAFVPSEARSEAYADAALALSHGQTISQPFIVALICQALELQGDERVLDVGTGSGYQAAVLAELAREVVSIERIPELAEQARRNLEAAGYDVEVRVGDGAHGVPERAPFDGIAVAAAATEVPEALYDQLVVGGRLVLPIEDSLVAVTRTPTGPRTSFLSAVRFVPLVPGLPD
jgi:protein-L-isoaspartate(D-aspartate) O-methyltransferase